MRAFNQVSSKDSGGDPGASSPSGTKRSLAEQIERWRDRVTIRLYTMRLEDVHYYVTADALIAPSRGDAFPMPPLEVWHVEFRL